MNRNKLNLVCYIEWNINESDNAIMNSYPTEVKVIDWNLSKFNVWLKGIPLSSLILNWTWGCIESSHWVQSYEFSLEISFCPWLLYFEMIGQKKQRILELRKDELVHHVTLGILTNPTSKTLLLGRNLAFTLYVLFWHALV